MAILVTGGGGFLGKQIVYDLLDEDRKVRIFGRSKQPELERSGVEVVCGDLADAKAVDEAVAGCDCVFHVAAKAGVWGAFSDYYDVNVKGTQNVLDACRKHSVRHLVYTSTPSVVFNGQAIRGADESMPYGSGWLCPYPETKALAEQAVLQANNRDGLRTCALRPHLIWGEGDPHIVPRIIAQAKRGRLRIIGTGKNCIDITHVRNAAKAHLLALKALDKGVAGGKAYFISDGQPVVLWDWINELLDRLGIQPISKSINERAAYLLATCYESVWRILKLKGEPPLTRFVTVELAKDHWFCIDAAKKDLGYQPAEGRRQKAEGRRQKVEGRRQKAEGRRQKAEGRRQKAEARSQKAEGRRQKAEGRRQKAEGRRQKAGSGTGIGCHF